MRQIWHLSLDTVSHHMQYHEYDFLNHSIQYSMHLQFKFELPGRIQVNEINLLNIANKIKKLQILICTLRYNSKPREKIGSKKSKKKNFAEGTETTLGKVILC